MSEPRRLQLFTLAAMLLRPEGDGTVTTRMMHGYRFAMDGQDAVVRRYRDEILAANPGFSPFGELSVLEISKERFEMTGFCAEVGLCERV